MTSQASPKKHTPRRRTVRRVLGVSVEERDLRHLAQLLDGLLVVPREQALAFVTCRVGANALSSALFNPPGWREPLLFELSVADALNQAAVLAWDFSYLSRSARVIESPVPHILAEHPWQQGTDFGVANFLAVRTDRTIIGGNIPHPS